MIIPEITNELPDHEEIRSWWFVFTDYDGLRHAPWWVHVWTRSGFRHVFFITNDGMGPGAIITNCLVGTLHVAWAPYKAEACAIACVRQGYTVVKVDAKPRRSYAARGILSCVSLAKAAIGCDIRRIITPWQLYKHIIKAGEEIRG